MFRQLKFNSRTIRIFAFVLIVSSLGIALAASISPSPASALAGETNRAEGGSGKKAASFELLRRPSLRSKSNFTRRVGEVNRDICGRNRGCTTKLQKEQARRGGSCGVATGNATSCDKLSDGRIISTEKGLGTGGETGGKAIARQVVKGSLAAVTIGSVLLNTKDQVRDPDYVDGDRTYVINVVGKSRKTNETVNLKNVKVILQVHVERGEKNGCRNNGTGHEGIYSPELSAHTGSGGVASFEHCSHQQITLKLENIPDGYKKVWSQADGRALEVRSVQDNIPNSTVDNGLITVTLEKLEPKKSKEQVCAEEAAKVLDKEQEPTGSYGITGGSRVTYSEVSNRAVIHDVLSDTRPLDFNKATTNECKEQISHSRQYNVRVHSVTYPQGKKQDIRQSFPVEIKFHGNGSCKSPNPHQSGTDSIVKFKGCTRNQIDLEVGTQKNFPVVHRVDKNEGYLRVKANTSKNGSIVYINVYLENELQPYGSVTVSQFAAAANRYWRPRADEGKKNGLPNTGIDKAVCKPNNVQIRYNNESVNRTFVSSDRLDALAEASGLGSAYVPISGRRCFITVNTQASLISINSNPRNACLMFVHEYGHLLGYGHPPNKAAGATNTIMFYRPRYATQEVINKTACNYVR